MSRDAKAGAAHTIRRIEVSGGFLDGLCLNLDEGLNCIIGPQARKVIDALRDPEALFAIESADMVDKPRIELHVNGEYRDSLALSTGQKCTTVLPILLLDSVNPLLVDQPEDNLDNRFVFTTVVRRLREVKQHRQLLLVTHNPNIPVLGDAGQVFVLSADSGKGEIVRSGSVDECRDEIVTLLEGGKEAFDERGRRYSGA